MMRSNGLKQYSLGASNWNPQLWDCFIAVQFEMSKRLCQGRPMAVLQTAQKEKHCSFAKIAARLICTNSFPEMTVLLQMIYFSHHYWAPISAYSFCLLSIIYLICTFCWSAESLSYVLCFHRRDDYHRNAKHYALLIVCELKYYSK